MLTPLCAGLASGFRLPEMLTQAVRSEQLRVGWAEIKGEPYTVALSPW